MKSKIFVLILVVILAFAITTPVSAIQYYYLTANAPFAVTLSNGTPIVGEFYVGTNIWKIGPPNGAYTPVQFFGVPNWLYVPTAQFFYLPILPKK